MYTKIKYAVVAGLIIAVVPFVASADSSISERIKELQEQIERLQVKITVLQSQLDTGIQSVEDDSLESGSGTGVSGTVIAPPPESIEDQLCFKPLGDLDRGSRGDDVKELQEYLAEDSEIYPEKITSGIYGRLTEKAVKRFQKKYGIISHGGPGTTGYGRVGPRTRAIMGRQLCREAGIRILGPRPGQVVSSPLKITGFVNGNGWTAFEGQAGKVALYDGNGRKLASGVLTTASNWMRLPAYFKAVLDFENPLTSSGKLVFYSASARGFGRVKTHTLPVRFTRVTPPTVSGITVISPNGGESWQKGTKQVIKWQDYRHAPFCSGTNCATSASKYYDIKLVPYYPSCNGSVCPLPAERGPYIIANSVKSDMFSWLVGKVANTYGTNVAPNGSYTIQICQAGSSICDSSDSYFKIVSSKSKIQVTSPNGGETWQKGTKRIIKWQRAGFADNSTVDISVESPPVACIKSPCSVIPAASYKIAVKTPNDGSITWKVGSLTQAAYTIPNGQYVVKIVESNTGASDKSDAAFSIFSDESHPQILSPKSGDAWQIGQTNKIVLNEGFTDEGHCSNAPALFDKNAKLIGYLPASFNKGATSILWDTKTLLSWSCGTSAYSVQLTPGTYQIGIPMMDGKTIRSGFFSIVSAGTTAESPTFYLSPSARYGSSIELKAIYDPDGPNGSQSPQNVSPNTSWTASNKPVVNIFKPGSYSQYVTVKPLSSGYGSIIATYKGYGAIADVTVVTNLSSPYIKTISTPVSSPEPGSTLSFSFTSTKIGVGGTAEVKALYDPDGPAGSQSLQNVSEDASWISANKPVASIGRSSSGSSMIITGVASGYSNIVALYNGLAVSRTVTITDAVGLNTSQLSPISATANIYNSINGILANISRLLETLRQ